jgi:hypothetical protein
MQRNPTARLMSLAAMAAAFSGAAVSHGKPMPIGAEAVPADVVAGRSHDPQSGRYAYRGNPGTRAYQRAAQKRRNRIKARRAAR